MYSLSELEAIVQICDRCSLSKTRTNAVFGEGSKENIISRGIWYKRGKFNIMATYHPAAILRDSNKKRDAREDFKSIKNMYIKLSQNL